MNKVAKITPREKIKKEFLLAADIVATAVTPGWKSIGLLAAIAGSRTFLNYFLHQEVKELEAEKRKNQVEPIFRH